MKRKPQMTKEEWIELGDMLKAIHNELIDIICTPYFKKSMQNDIHKAVALIDRYRSNAENEMFLQGIEDLDIFYGGKFEPLHD